MSSGRDEGPVYYREIQKNNYLKRIPSENTSGKLIPISHKKPPLKPMWTLFCVHNGRTPFLEQYPEPDSPLTLTHKPVWRACLKTARHVTASVKPHVGDEYDFLIDTDHGPVRMLAPDWDSMQDWVATLRNKLHELKILSKGENVYCAPPAAPLPRAGTRDPTSPLPPTPPVPPDRVPGIELNPTRPATTEPQLESEPETLPVQVDAPDTNSPEPSNTPEDVDISNWDIPFSSLPSTSTQEPKMEPKSVTKICGQNICLDDSILKRNIEVTDSDEEFFAEIDRIHSSVENLVLDGVKEYKQRVVVSNEKTNSSNSLSGNQSDQYHSTNITVIEVSNKGPPHTAIPVLGSETDVFNFDLAENDRNQTNFVNIVNTEDHKSADNRYGAIFLKDSGYDHLSLTTTVKVSDVKTDSLYERLCMASTSKTSNTEASPLPVKKLKTLEKSRKSSLPNLETESAYEYLFPNSSQNNNERNVAVNSDRENSNVTEAPCITRVTNGPIDPRVENPRPSESTTNAAPSVRSQVTNSLSIAGISDARIRSQVERSHSQNACDSTPRIRDHLIRRVQNNSPKNDVKNGDKTEGTPAKPIWKRGLTELSLLSKLRGIGQAKRQDSPTRQESNGVNGASDRGLVTSPVQVMHRSRPEARVDTARRRSNSLSNGQAPAAAAGGLQSLRQRQAAALRAEQTRGAALAASIPASDPPVFADYDKQVWVARWARGARCAGRAGDRVAALRGVAPRDAQHARQLVKGARAHLVDILFHRVPLGKIYVLNKWDHENLGIKLDGECNIVSVDGQSAAARAGLVPPGKWALTEVNNRPLNLVKGGEEEMNRLSMHGNEVSVLIQPSALVKKLRAALKSRTLLSR